MATTDRILAPAQELVPAPLFASTPKAANPARDRASGDLIPIRSDRVVNS
jgi:hypothetical protein